MLKVEWRAVENGLDAVQGIYAQGVACGIKKDKKDLAVLYSDPPAKAWGVFTQNLFQAAPVIVTREHLSRASTIQVLVANSGIANACTGERGIQDAREVAREAARIFGVPDLCWVSVASTGVIGEFLPVEKIKQGLREARSLLPNQSSGHNAALAIMTTDTMPKERAVEIETPQGVVHIAGIAKGAGMIKPNMATMLAFIATDADLEISLLRSLLVEAVEQSFNRITVDGDTSTNDMVLFMSNGASSTPLIAEGNSVVSVFKEALFWLTRELAKDIVRDAEGATKFVTVEVQGARSKKDARLCAYAIAESPLVKTAFFGEDPNWGRILAAAGRCGAKFSPQEVKLEINGQLFVERGIAIDVPREALEKNMKNRELHVLLNLGSGNASFQVWTCDFSFDYVKINSHYS
ncbi:bifunctional glutamate N-acetyltransferase/amino-acid acetyltransferase ArgJ [Thermatribacter velox]|jgi:glutamate N-acetyltransferase/amino-acid N-acetyltransferase|uniref:Arginine biosynthesis bifunctional protein ArgJ n=1 Tax=Thermatribacter velox TaxID=3039681 RepID=A0ABZ2YDB1_9BACT